MSKYILLFLILINIYKCDKKEEIETFLVNPNLVKEKEIIFKSEIYFALKYLHLLLLMYC